MMTSNRPYLVRAFYDWIIDNRLTPYILVDATYPGVQVPNDYVQEGSITLNIAPQAVQYPRITLQEIEFSASFAKRVTTIYVPMNAVLALYAHENGQGIVFTEEEGSSTPPQAPPEKKTILTIVK